MMMMISLLYQLSVIVFKKFKIYTLDPNTGDPGILAQNRVLKSNQKYFFLFYIDYVVSRLTRTILAGFTNVYNLTIMGNSVVSFIQQ